MSSHYQDGFFSLKVGESLNSEKFGKSSWPISFNDLFQKPFSYLCSAFSLTIYLRVVRHNCDRLDKVAVCTFLSSTEAKKQNQ